MSEFLFANLCVPEHAHILYSVDTSKHTVQWNSVLLQNDIPRSTPVRLHAPRRLQGYSLKLAGVQILQRSSSCHKLLMDDATSRKGCGCRRPEARITDRRWALPLNSRCPWLVRLLILYQWLCKRCTPIIHTDERAPDSILELQRGLLTWVALAERAPLWMQSWAHSASAVSTTALCDRRCEEGPALERRKKNICERGALKHTLFCVGVYIQSVL